MTHGGIEVVGADRLDRTLHDLARNLEDLTSANTKAGQVLLDRATSQTPRQSGQLAASGRVDADSDEATVSYTEVYAGVIHNGWDARNIEAQPWLSTTAADSESTLTEVYVEHLDDLVHHVQGA